MHSASLIFLYRGHVYLILMINIRVLYQIQTISTETMYDLILRSKERYTVVYSA